jgi:predicted ATPase/signal transduction histidine kinase/CheY-like chemotaxis protein/tRNA A-37 threonylcarbamoyl transferase component Bud32
MKNISNYQIIKKIYESANSLVYRGIRTDDNQPLILKILKHDYPTPDELTRYRQEYEMTKFLGNLAGTINVYGLEKYQNTLMMCLEDFGGESLNLWQKKHSFNLEELLNLAIRITDILGQIHQQNVIHKDINPSNLVWNPTTNILKIIDFGISTQLSKQQITLKNLNTLEGTLAYISPEQTGRMNRAVDYRTDFYSLGITLYELFTGQLPFQTTDATNLVHCHIAKPPQFPTQLNPDVPPAISNIIMKLLEKTAEARYQSTWGIKTDLENSLNQWQTDNTISIFPLATTDISPHFQIPQKLYGREPEIETVLAAFERVANETGNLESDGNAELILITGSSGIGKSAFIKEIMQSLTEQTGYVIYGLFEQQQQNIPYSAIVTAFSELVQHILTETESQLMQWKEQLLTALGSNGQVIIEIIPEIECIIGPQPAISTLGPTEFQNRFNLVFQKFMRVFCQPEHPLVIFLDNLQWADLATLKLLEVMMTDSDIKHFFMIGAYRDNEVDHTHPLMMMIDSLTQEKITISQITLKPLAFETINQLIADSLYQTPTAVESLTDLVMRKTFGHPFFVNQFLTTLYEENLLFFVPPKSPLSKGNISGWHWDINQIEAMNITENVVDLMIGQFKKLPKSAQQVLRLAACIGNQFDLDTLSVIYEKSAIDTFQDLVPVLTEGFILPISKLQMTGNEIRHLPFIIHDFRFLHERVQQAAYALIDDKDKKAVHLKIGQLLLTNLSAKAQTEKLFKIVYHLNLGRSLIREPQKQLELAQLNLQAGQKAKMALAYPAARTYLNMGMHYLPKNSWETQLKLTFKLHQEMAEVEYLNKHYQQAIRLIFITIDKAKSALEKAEMYALLMRTYSILGKYQEEIETGLKALSLLNMDLPNSNSNAQEFIIQEMAEIEQRIGKRKIASLVNEPKMRSPEMRMAIQLMTSILPTTITLGHFDLHHQICSRAVNLCLKYGYTPESAQSYIAYSTLQMTLGDYLKAYEFGKLAMKICERFNNTLIKARTYIAYGTQYHHFGKPLKHAIPILDEGYKAALESGEFAFASYALHSKTANLFSQGQDLEQILTKLPQFLQFAEKTQNQLVTDSLLGFQLIISNLVGQTHTKWDFHHEKLSEAQYLENCQNHKSFLGLALYHILKIITYYLYGEFDKAEQLTEHTEKLLHFITVFFTKVEYHFYHSLILIALYPKSSRKTQQKYWENITKNQQQMKNWCDQCPENFQHQYFLVQAEMSRIEGKELETVMELYEQAIASARDHSFIQHEALANELTAKFWLTKGKEAFAELYFKRAHHGYRLWGAKRKVEDLEEKYPLWLTQKISHQLIDSMFSVTTTALTFIQTHAFLDFNSVVKASQILSGEMVLSRLLEKMMHIVIENAGAEKGFLLLPQQNEWFIEAEGHIDSSKVTVLQSIPLPLPQPPFEKREIGKISLSSERINFPQSPFTSVRSSTEISSFETRKIEEMSLSSHIIYYVVRTKKNVVLSDATQENHLNHDPYIIKHHPKSILCMPLLNQGQLTGILYLENNLTTGAFTYERLEVLNLLSAQMAISIENSLLYKDLEKKVAERTLELEQQIEVRKRAEESANIANQAKSIFIASMSHELRSPLNAILGFTDIVLKNPKLEKDDQEHLKIINRSGEHLLTLINQVLDLSKIESGRATLNETDFDLYHLLDDLENMFHQSANHKNLSLIFDCEPSVPQYIRTDEIKLRQVLINLLNNALKFTKTGSVTVRILPRIPQNSDHQEISSIHEISLLTPSSFPKPSKKQFGNDEDISETTKPETIEKPSLQFEIEDTGVGIPSDELETIFEAFVQANSGQVIAEGTGLGLAISRKFIELMGGQITVNSEIGHGATFQFYIHYQLAKVTSLPKPIPEKQVIALAPNQPRYRILIVDDKWSNRQLLIKLLNPFDFELRETENGQQAINLWKEWQPHLIWMDMRMPIMDGYEATRQIKRHAKGQATTIIALTAGIFKEKQSIVFEIGCDDLLLKPFKEADIFELMHKHLGVEYLYDDPMKKIKDNELLTPDKMAILPTELLVRLEDAAACNDLERVENIINEIRSYNIDLAKKLSKIADNFDYDTILDLIRQTKDFQQINRFD